MTRAAPAPRSATARAWVESPLQLLSVVEAHAQGLLGRRTTVVLRAGSEALAATGRAVEGLGPPSGLHIAPPGRLRRLRRLLVGGHRSSWFTTPHFTTWGVGDAFSGVVQGALVAVSPRRVVVVDDGMATLHLLDSLVRPDMALVRARSTPGRARRALGRLGHRRLRAAARRGRLVVFTALPLDPELAASVRALGVQLHQHRFEWLAAKRQPPAPEERLVVLGSSLVANGLVRADAYTGWLRQLAAQAPVAYYPHRREDLDLIAPLEARGMLRVHRERLPVEMSLRGLVAGQRVVTLSSTAALSLAVLLRPRGVPVDAIAIPASWWTARAAPSTRTHLNRVVELQRSVAG